MDSMKLILDLDAPNPYIVGAVVPTDWVAARTSLIAAIEAVWNRPGPREPLILYGARRSGKTSLISNLAQVCRLGGETAVAVVSLQRVDWSSNSLSDLCYLLAFELWANGATEPEPSPESFEGDPLAVLCEWLDGTNEDGRYILILDEYELLAELSEADRWAFLGFLEHTPIRYPWLTVALAGLHPAADARAMGGKIPMGWREIRVGRLSPDEFAACLSVNGRVPFLDSAMAYAYTLTGGQPFLGQLLGYALIESARRNRERRVLPITQVAVAAAVGTALFQQGAASCFDAIWAQAAAGPSGQRALLLSLARAGGVLDRAHWQALSGLASPAFAQALAALDEKDIVVAVSGGYGYAIELLSGWVVAQASANSTGPAESPTTAIWKT